MPQKQKNIFDYITEWFRELKELDVAGLLVGLGFVVVFINALLFGSSPTIQFWVIIGVGVLMIVLGAYIKILEIKHKPRRRR
jgi:hypothetical protein